MTSFVRNRAGSTVSALERLASLTGAGIAIGDGIKIAASIPGPGRKILARTRRLVERGTPVSRALERSGARLDAADVALIAAGERSGELGGSLAALATALRSRRETRRRFTAAVAYPAVLLATALGIAAFLSAAALPSFARIYADGGRELPAATRIAVATGEFLRNWGAASVLTAFAASLVVGTARRRRPFVRRATDALVWRLPGLGDLVRTRCRADLYAALARMIHAGVDLETAFAFCIPGVPNTSARTSAKRIAALVERGLAPSAAIARSGLDPTGTDGGILRISEETGDLGGGFERAAVLAGARYDARVAIAAKTVEPLAVMILAVIVGGFVLAVYQPLLGMSDLFASGIR